MISHGPPQPRKYLFIDGGYIRERCAAWGSLLSLPTLPLSFERLKSGYVRAYYYDAEPERRETEDESTFLARAQPYRTLREELRDVDSLHVREGIIRGVKPQRQKAVDVLLAVDMLSHSLRGKFERATLLSGDLDFLPAVHALVESGILVTVWAEKKTVAADLIDAADSSQDFSFEAVYHGFGKPELINRFGKVRSVQRSAENLLSSEWTTLAKSGASTHRIMKNLSHGFVELVDLPPTASGMITAKGVEGGSESPDILLKAFAKAEYGIQLA